jgi:hypothetical protein
MWLGHHEGSHLAEAMTPRDAQPYPVNQITLDQAPFNDALDIVRTARLTGGAGTHRNERLALV